MTRNEMSIHVLRKLVVDGFFICGLVLCILATNYLWVPFRRGFFCGDESLVYPYHADTVTVPMLRGVGLGLPVLAFLICEWALLRSQKDDQRCFGIPIPAWLRGFYCALVSFCLGLCLQELATNIAKYTIGRPRPHFIDVCQPSVMANCTTEAWRGRYIQSTEYHCTGIRTELFKDMGLSFPSGHSSWAAYTMVYLALYLERRMLWNGTRVIRHTIQFGVVMLSWYTALSRVTDYKHHWSDVLCGYTLGVIFAALMATRGTDFVKRERDLSLPQYDTPVFHLSTIEKPITS